MVKKRNTGKIRVIDPLGGLAIPTAVLEYSCIYTVHYSARWDHRKSKFELRHGIKLIQLYYAVKRSKF